MVLGRRWGWAIVAAGVLAGGCGGSGGSEEDSRVAVVVAPQTVAVPPGGTQGFVAAVSNTDNRAVTWNVAGGSGSGTITADGTYTAPATPGTYRVIATSQADSRKSATATITVRSGVFVAPPTATVGFGESVAFASTVVGQPSQVVVWSVQEAGGGSVTEGGVYTAPFRRGTFHVVATSNLDPALSATTTVVVQAGTATGSIE